WTAFASPAPDRERFQQLYPQALIPVVWLPPYLLLRLPAEPAPLSYCQCWSGRSAEPDPELQRWQQWAGLFAEFQDVPGQARLMVLPVYYPCRCRQMCLAMC